MKNLIHPSILTIKRLVKIRNIHYSDIAQRMNCTEQHIKDIFSGRIGIGDLWERDAFCKACELSAVEVLLQQTSEQEKEGLLPLNLLTPTQKQIMLLLFNDMTQNYNRK